MAATEWLVGRKFGEQIENSFTGAAVGGALGYSCGYVEGFYNSGGNLAAAAATGIEYAQAGAAFGAALGYVGASQTLWVQYFAGITGLVAGELFVADYENLGQLTIRTACGVVAFGVAKAGRGLPDAPPKTCGDNAPSKPPTRKVFHKGELLGGKVGTQRELSTGLERESVEALMRPGKVHEFEILEDTLWRWEMEGKVRRLRDYDHQTGTYNEELRFSPTVAEEMNKCIVN